MNLAILVPWRNKSGEKSAYNRQEIGLAKALMEAGHKVCVVKAAGKTETWTHTCCNGGTFQEYRRRTLRIQSHGIFSVRFLRSLELDGMIGMTDLQLLVPHIYRWCNKNHIAFWPYLGTMTSNSSNHGPLNAWLSERNLRVCRKCHCLAKTPDFLQYLKQNGVEKVALMPVGLDFDNLTTPTAASRAEARAHFGYTDADKVVCFVGALDGYKRPLEALEVFAEIRNRQPAAKLLAVGDGPLLSQFEAKVQELGIQDSMTHVRRLAQGDMWRVYSASDLFINLNEGEIFGMVIMESLFYGLPVVAVEAPGPSFFS